jgi:hypothetical protein
MVFVSAVEYADETAGIDDYAHGLNSQQVHLLANEKTSIIFRLVFWQFPRIADSQGRNRIMLILPLEEKDLTFRLS